jgi:uncharacterized membrane protein/glutaredoxin
MAKSAGKQGKKQGQGKSEPVVRKRRLPNWPLLVLAVVGLLLAGYLTVTTWMEAPQAFCTEDGGCATVQSSAWGSLLGMPIAFWGFLTYLALAWIALRVRDGAWHWKLAFVVSLVGLSVSVYLTAISLVLIEATCFYCLSSLAVMAAIFGVTCYQYPGPMPGFAWPGWLAQTVGLAAVVVIGLHGYHAGWWGGGGPEDPYFKALATYIADADATFYGASWCPHCQEQKRLFGSSQERLPYVECSPQGRSGPRAAACIQENIQAYPTWIINGRRYERVIEPYELARITGFRGLPQEARD